MFAKYEILRFLAFVHSDEQIIFGLLLNYDHFLFDHDLGVSECIQCTVSGHVQNPGQVCRHVELEERCNLFEHIFGALVNIVKEVVSIMVSFAFKRYCLANMTCMNIIDRFLQDEST